MNVRYERRTCEDRRKFAQTQCYYFGPERRNKTADRRLAPAEVVKGTATTFGARPDSLEIDTLGNLANDTGHCQSCKNKAMRCAELEAELAESKKNAARYRRQLEDLLLSIAMSRH
jgi:hypothetical protein